MTKKKFNEIWKHLERYYSDVTGKETQTDELAVKEYYNACFCVRDEKASRFYSDVVANFKYFPRISEVREFAERYIEAAVKHENTEYCYCCLNTGIVPYVKKGIPPFTDCEYEFASRCFCDAGKNFLSWPLCSDIVSDGVLDRLCEERRENYGKITTQESKSAKAYVTTFIKTFGSK